MRTNHARTIGKRNGMTRKKKATFKSIEMFKILNLNRNESKKKMISKNQKDYQRDANKVPPGLPASDF